MTPPGHPLWLAGFRPFFALAMVAGALLPPLWVLIYAGVVAAPAAPFSPIQWHAHEMFFGFGWAVLGGFLLTATKNWVQIRGYHGAALMLLAAAWGLERLGMALAGALPPPLFAVSNKLFLGAIVLMLAHTLIRHRRRDTFRDNGFFLLILPAFLVAKELLLDPAHFHAGWSMSLALFRVAFLVMLERTLTQFMQGAFQVAILRDLRLDMAIKAAAVLLVAGPWLPPALSAGLGALLALLLAVRLVFWQPRLAARRIEIGIMYLGYLFIVVQLTVEATARLAPLAWTGAVSAHLFAFGVMGLVIPAMLVRISKGHTGRRVVFEPADKVALYAMMAGLVLRLALPQLAPAAYLLWLALAAACWSLAFGLLAWRYLPLLTAPRADGREH